VSLSGPRLAVPTELMSAFFASSPNPVWQCVVGQPRDPLPDDAGDGLR
jgi:hypothetical protein